jgi:phosphonate transport system substrate-binding protein
LAGIPEGDGGALWEASKLEEKDGEKMKLIIMKPFGAGKTGPALIRILLAVLIALVPVQALCYKTGVEREPFSAVIGYSSSIFTHLVKENAQAAAKLWSNLVIRNNNGSAETRIFQNCSEMEKELKSGKIDMVILLSTEYLGLKNRGLLEPFFISARGEELYDTFILITRRDSGIHSVGDLRGKAFLQQSGSHCEIHRLWFDMLMMKQGVHEPERFFSSLKEVVTPSQAVMPVFFKRADACILSRRSFDVMAELNPQLRKDLRIIEASTPVATGVICIRKGCDSRQRERLIEVLETLDRDVEGKQLLTLFRMSRLVPFRPEYMTSVEAFLKEYNELRTRSRKR